MNRQSLHIHNTPAKQPSTTTSSCPICTVGMVSINLVVDGDDLTMNSCTDCDIRFWHRGASAIQLGSVLADLESRTTRYRRNYAARS